jgi:alpha-glucoside transport system ATP-binding protein
MSTVKLTEVSKAYGTVEVLRHINLDIEQGELIVFVGPSGCGKSTLLRMIAGLERITGGTLEIGGRVVNDVPPSQRGIAMVFQSYALYPHMTVRDNMAFGLKIAKKSKEEITRKVEEAAKMLQLSHLLDRLPKALSGGQRQRVAIGRSIVRDPQVFLFDEPLSNLDAALRVATRIEIAQLKERLAKSTMIYVTHDQVEAMTLASRIVVLHGGDIEQVGAPLTLYEKPANTFVARFIGSPAMNMFKGTIQETGNATTVRLDAGGTVHVPIPSHANDRGAPVQVGVRPEDMTLANGHATEALYRSEVSIVEGLGDNTLLYLARNGEEQVIAKLPGTHRVARGSSVEMHADPAKLHMFDGDGRSFLYR